MTVTAREAPAYAGCFAMPDFRMPAVGNHRTITVTRATDPTKTARCRQRFHKINAPAVPHRIAIKSQRPTLLARNLPVAESQPPLRSGITEVMLRSSQRWN